MEAAMSAFKQKHYRSGFVDLVKALGEIPTMLTKCGAAKADVKRLKDALAHITRKEMEQNIVAHKWDLLTEFVTAGGVYSEGDFSEAGRQIGLALRRVLEADAIFV